MEVVTKPAPKPLGLLGRDEQQGRDELNLVEFPISLLGSDNHWNRNVR